MPGTSVALRIGQRVRLGVSVPPTPGGANPWLLESDLGTSYWLSVKDGAIHIDSSWFGGPAFHQHSVPVTTGAANPRMEAGSDGRLWLIFEKGGDAWSAWSRDEAKTFTEPAVVIVGGSKPTMAASVVGDLLFLAIVGGVLKARIWQAGRSVPGSVFTVRKFDEGMTTDFAVADDSFQLDQERQPHGRMWLHVVAAGEPDTSAWWSSDWARHDNSLTFTRGPS